jgi:predicted dehydrogenase/threonine dehydrogenase-like Zn-dependent dehydrogenase
VGADDPSCVGTRDGPLSSPAEVRQALGVIVIGLTAIVFPAHTFSQAIVMKQVAQNYKTGELALLEVPVPSCRQGGVLVRSAFSLVSAGTEMMKVAESRLSLVAKARARPDHVRKVLRSVHQQGLVNTYKKVMNRLDAYTPLGYSLSGDVVEVAPDVREFKIGQRVACGGNRFALHAEYNWVPVNLCVAVPDSVAPEHAAFATVGAIALHGVRQSGLQYGESACVIGLGLVGQLLVRLLRGAGVHVVGIDPVATRCRLAEEGGASATVHPKDCHGLVDEIKRWTDGFGVDCVFLSASGTSNQPVEMAALLARDRGRIVDIGKCRLDLPWTAYYEKELDVRFSRSYGPGRYDALYEEAGIDYPVGYARWTERRNMDCIIKMMACGALDVGPLVQRVAPFERAVSVYEEMSAQRDGGSVGLLYSYSAGSSPLSRALDVPEAPRPSPSVAAKAPRQRVRFGVIGCGNYASSMLLPRLARREDVELVEVVTTRALSAANAQRKHGFSRVSTDHGSLLARDDIDAILIATPHRSHAALVCAALRAGRSVFVEKPLAISAEQLREVGQTIAETGNDRIMVGFNRRFAPLLREMKGLWGPLRPPHVLHCRINAGPLDPASWYADTREHGSRFVGEGGHFIDTASWWFEADPVDVSARVVGSDPDNLCATLTYPGGSIATIAYLTAGDPNYPKEFIEIFGQGRAARLDNFRKAEVWYNGHRHQRRRMSIDKGQRDQLDAFIRAIKTGGAMPISLSSLLATTTATLEVAGALGRQRLEGKGSGSPEMGSSPSCGLQLNGTPPFNC